MIHPIEKTIVHVQEGELYFRANSRYIHKKEWKLKHTICDLCVHINSAQPCVQNIIKCRTTDIYCTTVKKKKK